MELATLIAEKAQELLDVVGGRMRGLLGEYGADVSLEIGILPLAAAEADDAEVIGQQALAAQVEQRWHHLARHQVAGRAEDDEDGGCRSLVV